MQAFGKHNNGDCHVLLVCHVLDVVEKSFLFIYTNTAIICVTMYVKLDAVSKLILYTSCQAAMDMKLTVLL